MNITIKENITKNKNSNKLHILSALIVASFLMFVFGVGYRVLATRLSAYSSTFLFSPDILDKFPMQIGDWIGSEVPIDEKIIIETDTDAHISRSYLRQSDLKPVWFYVAFGVKARDLMPHRPEVCYAFQGFQVSNFFRC